MPRKTWLPQHVELFTSLLRAQCNKMEICDVMGISRVDILDRLIKENFPETPTWAEVHKKYAGEGLANLKRKMYETAMDGSVPMQMFLAKNLLGMTDKPEKPKKDKPVESHPDGRLTVLTNSSRFAGKMAKAANE